MLCVSSAIVFASNGGRVTKLLSEAGFESRPTTSEV